eukprot:6029380-Pleurochrysis_carterae.AAC.1
MPYVGKRLGRLIIKFLQAALAGEGRALLRELIDKTILGNENKVIEETEGAPSQNGAHVSSGIGSSTRNEQEGQAGGRSGGAHAKQRQARQPTTVGRRAVRAPRRAMVLEGNVPLQPRQGRPRVPMLSGSALARTITRE